MANRVKLSAIAKDEGAYLADWVGHHLYFGFDGVEVWVNDTEDASIRILRRIQKVYPQVSAQRADRLLAECLASGASFHRRAYTRAARRAKREGYSHVMFLDLDEYWVPRDFNTSIHSFLRTDADVNVISFLWCFGQPRQHDFTPPVRRVTPVQVERYVKSVVRMDGSVRKFREHTARTRRGRRLLASTPFRCGTRRPRAVAP